MRSLLRAREFSTSRLIEQEIFYRFELGRVSSDLCIENHITAESLKRRVSTELSSSLDNYAAQAVIILRRDGVARRPESKVRERRCYPLLEHRNSLALRRATGDTEKSARTHAA